VFPHAGGMHKSNSYQYKFPSVTCLLRDMIKILPVYMIGDMIYYLCMLLNE